jgi:hypothetical protein
MTKKQQIYKKKLIQLIHLSSMYQNHYKHNIDDYQDLLETHFWVKSSKDLSLDNLEIFLDYLNGKRTTLPVTKVLGDSITNAQLNKLKLEWGNNSSSKCIDSLINFLSNKVIKRKINTLQELTKLEATNSIVVVGKLKAN